MDEFHKCNVEPNKLDTEEFITSESVSIGANTSQTDLLLKGQETWAGVRGLSVWVMFHFFNCGWQCKSAHCEYVTLVLY